ETRGCRRGQRRVGSRRGQAAQTPYFRLVPSGDFLIGDGLGGTLTGGDGADHAHACLKCSSPPAWHHVGSPLSPPGTRRQRQENQRTRLWSLRRRPRWPCAPPPC